LKAELRLKPHSVLPGANVIEVVWNGRLVCTIAGADGPGIRVISKYTPDTGSMSIEPPRAGIPGVVEIRFELPPVASLPRGRKHRVLNVANVSCKM